MNSSNNKTARIVIILMAIACVAVMAVFGFSLTGEEQTPTGSNPMELPSTSVSSTDSVG